MEQGTPNAGREKHSLAEAQRPVCSRALTDRTPREALECAAEEEMFETQGLKAFLGALGSGYECSHARRP